MQEKRNSKGRKMTPCPGINRCSWPLQDRQLSAVCSIMGHVPCFSVSGGLFFKSGRQAHDCETTHKTHRSICAPLHVLGKATTCIQRLPQPQDGAMARRHLAACLECAKYTTRHQLAVQACTAIATAHQFCTGPYVNNGSQSISPSHVCVASQTPAYQ